MDINYASEVKRAFAYIIDQIIYIVVLFVFTFILAIFGVTNEFVLATIISIIMCVLDFVQLTIFNGRTIGKIVLKLRILDINTMNTPSSITFIKRIILIRPVIQLVSVIYSLLGLLYALFGLGLASKNEYKQSLWDKFAGTVVVDETNNLLK